MADEAEEMVIVGLYGPYRGARLTVAGELGRQAIADGWARDAFSEPEEPKELSEEEMAKIVAKAEAGARRLRGEDAEEAGKEEAEKIKAIEAGDDKGEYQTRQSKAKKK